MRKLLRSHPEADIRLGLAVRYPWYVWLAILGTFSVVHYLVWGIVHNIVDMRVCVGVSPDPLLAIIPYDERWTFVTRDLYVAVLLIATVAVLYQAFRGIHTPGLRWGLGLTFMSSMRIATLLLIPLCRPTVQPFGPPPLASWSMVNLHFFSVPWRIFALNDVVYSGHASVFLLLLLATNTWPNIARFCVAAFLALMIYGMLAMRDHYSVDILLAFPCSYAADALAVSILRTLNSSREKLETAAIDSY